MNNINKKYSIILILLFSVLMVTVQSKDDSSKDSKDSKGGGPFAFLQNIFSGFGGGKKK